MNDDILFIKQFLEGDDRGFDALVSKYQDRVFNIIYSLIGNDMESEDIAQEVFLKVYYNLRTFRQDCQFSTWLYRIVMNVSYSFLRKRKDDFKMDQDMDQLAGHIKDPAEMLIVKEREALFKNMLSKVPLKFRVAMVLKDIDGLSYKEISLVLNCSIGTVESKIYRAREFLKDALSKMGGI